MTIAEYFRNIGWTASCLVNAEFLGEPDESLSSRIGRSILSGGAWSYVPMPGWLRAHFTGAAR